jgi:opacity protein-like surface antigen
MKLRSWMGCLSVVALGTAAPALAIEATQVGERLGFEQDKTRVGLDVRLGAGSFTGELADRTGTGPLLGIAAGAQPWRNLGIELGYEGQRLPIEDPRIGEGEAMWRHNASLMAMAGPLLVNDRLRPYVGAGFGLSYLNASDGATDTGLYANNDFTSEVPLAAGLDYRFGEKKNIFAGARATYRLVYGEEFVDSATTVGEDAKGNLLNFSATVGGRF